MAKIERYIAGPGRTPSGGGVVIPQSSMAGYSAFGNALQSVGQTIDEVDEHFRKARQASLMSSLKIGLARETSDIEIEYDDRQDYDKFSDISDRIGKMRQEYMDKIGHDNEIMELFMPQFEDSAIRLETGVRKLARSKFVDADRAALGNEIDNVMELAGRSGKYEQISGEILAMGKAAIAGRAASGVIGREDAENAINRFEAQLWDNYFTAQTRSKPIETSEALKDDKLFPGLSRDKRLYWQGVAEKASNEKKADIITDDAASKYPDDFNAQEDWVKGLDYDKDFKNKIISRIRSSQAESDNRKHEAKVERRTAAENEYWAALGDKNYGSARKIAENLDVKGGDFTEQERQTLIARTQSAVNKTDEYNWRQMRWNILQGKYTDKSQLWTDPLSSTITNEDMMKLETQMKSELKNPSGYDDALKDIEYTFKALYSKDSDKGLKYLMFQKEFLKQIETLETERKRKLTPDEIRQAGRDNLEKRDIPWARDKSVFEMLWKKQERKPIEPSKPQNKTLTNSQEQEDKDKFNVQTDDPMGLR